MSNFVLNAISREDQGKGASRRLRREGLVPAVVYGGTADEAPVAISLVNKDLIKQLDDQTFFSSILTVALDGKETQVIIKDLQRHPAKPAILHADFQRIAADQKIKINVPISFINFEKSAASKNAAKFAVEANVVEILCLPKDLPEVVTVDLSNVAPTQILHLSDISLPEGVEIATLRRGEDYDQGIGYVYSPRGAKAS
ncbi:50S ribosomal protein L25/general stress protein Ctc [Neptunomonas phycophila]|jgi:large subunit ribosomal protein L25|uniref:Large ribosomal subunit protein bL25 n=1 Tax=Neptunomonas phycophila TaxID=1572645 RepID=A0AAW7XMJ5_9GAMM|nr:MULTISPECIES: 50S ribosomal protein L25/general stress protein Ctc [Neptunomonas]MDN2658292.1 50S ribosomal protein L25/general stress protein Ctc [Neptunomonas sp. CHC150]MDO6454118.1 50S ribosomal protein L25/general stress protein Ctc [Neptunomonas phycophila]MDO6468645.1 50S ribosomal protein L25/general stress protein Ctc [Neptunomonas phycophila]MDP2523285.1 50S ribosomal protein L25/general stress protein Ctc [Neptunomonas phycophila]QLE98741.1 50S ribosomal protein L25/general stres